MEQTISELFSHYAYSPYLVYGAILLFMLLSAFGLPIPEEVVLLSAGFVGFMALHPSLYPPPYPGAVGVNPYILAAVAFFSVMVSDYLIYWLGRRFGPRVMRLKFFARMIRPSAMEKIQRWVQKYGYWAVLIFRFTPGVRFPGHLMCGAMGLSPWKFIGVDLIAAGISVPTQVLLMAFYGKEILAYLKQFKIVLFSLLGAAFIVFIAMKILERRRQTREAGLP